MAWAMAAGPVFGSGHRAFAALLLALVALAGCTRPTPVITAPPEAVARAAYHHDGPPALTLYTMINNRTGSGAHTSLMINASQRIIWDPAGSVARTGLVENNDVLYGITPEIERFYRSAHARKSFHVVIQRIEVPPAVAEQALRLAVAHGPAGGGTCTITTARILAQLPGFESIRPTYFPKRLMDQFGRVPGVSTETLYENDADETFDRMRTTQRRG